MPPPGPVADSSTPARVPPEPESAFDVDGEDALERMRELHARFGDIYRVYSPTRQHHVYVINHPDDVKRVLATNQANYRKGIGLDRVRVLVGNGIVTSDGELWRRQRYMMQPMFHRRVLERFATLIDQANEELLQRWQQHAQRGEPVNVTDDLSALTLQVILRSIFGHDLERLARQGNADPFALIAQDSARDLTFAYRFRELRRLVSGLAERRRTEADAQAESSHPDFLGMLVAARDKDSGAPMSERELVDEVMTLIIAGHETAASGLNSAWYLLSQHPQAEARLHAEVDAAGEQPCISLAASEALPYTRGVVAEALRLYPPVWLLARRALQPDVLAGYDIPAGADVLISPYFVHRHPQFWEEPEAFRPERPDLEGARSPYARIPFGAGPRRCVGEAMGLYEMTAHLYKTGRRYRLVYPQGQPMELEALINLRSKQPLMMRLEPR